MQQQPAAMEVCGEGGEAEKLGLGLGFWAAARRRLAADDPFFASGDLERELLAKHVALDLTEDDRYQLQKMEVANVNTVFCPIAGCGARLDCLEDFEDHYSTRHSASCSMCSRVYPTSRLLSIHLSEVHDSFFQAKVARGFPMYECLVEGCNAKLKSYKSRQQHLVDKHQFPNSFEFFKKARPSKHQRQKQQRRQAAHRGEEAPETCMDVDGKASKQANWKYRPKAGAEAKGTSVELGQPLTTLTSLDEAKENAMEVEEKIDDLASAVSRLSTSDSVPASISFGHRHARGLAFVPHSIRQSKKQASQPEGH